VERLRQVAALLVTLVPQVPVSPSLTLAAQLAPLLPVLLLGLLPPSNQNEETIQATFQTLKEEFHDYF
jgi:hypothetical protein